MGQELSNFHYDGKVQVLYMHYQTYQLLVYCFDFSRFRGQILYDTLSCSLFNIILILLEKINLIINKFIKFVPYDNMDKHGEMYHLSRTITLHNTNYSWKSLHLKISIDQQTYIDCYCQRVYVYKLCNYTQHSLSEFEKQTHFRLDYVFV